MPHAPAGVAAVEVYVVDISASTQIGSAADGDVWNQIYVPRRSFDLAQLQGDSIALAGGDIIPPDIYYAIRLTIDADSSRVVFDDGTAAKVSWPNDGNFSVSVPLDAPIVAPDSGTSILIEFDLERSLVGGLGNPLYDFLFSPVARAVDLSVTGAIHGVILADTNGDGQTVPVEGALVSVLESGQDSSPDTWLRTSAALTDSSGYYRVGYLVPGFYSVEIDVPEVETFGRLMAHDVEIVSGVDFVLSVTLPIQLAAGIPSWR
jgi:hypothetical protein